MQKEIFAFVFFTILLFQIASASTESEFLEMINKERESLGKHTLTYNSKLTKAAELHAQDMVNKNYFSHTSIDGTSFSKRISNQGYLYRAIGENIAYHSGVPSAEKVFNMWKNSPGHYSNMISASFSEMGLGVVYDGRRTMYVQDLGSSRSPYLPPSRPPNNSPPSKPLVNISNPPLIPKEPTNISFKIEHKKLRNYMKVTVIANIQERADIVSIIEEKEKRICTNCRKFSRSYRLGLNDKIPITYSVYFKGRNIKKEYNLLLK